MRTVKTVEDVLAWAAIPVTETGCWLWLGQTTGRKGYGRIKRGTAPKIRRHLAHRFVYELVNGPIPEGMCLCHKCDVTCCVNPSHMFLGTKAQNNHDRASKNRCAKGESGGNSKLKEPWIRDIRKSKARTDFLASIYGVHRKTVSSIRRGITWKHVA